VRARELGRDLDEVWGAETTTARDQKRLLRCLIEEVQLRSEKKRYLVRIVWKGGATTEREVPRFAPGGQAHATPADTVELVRKLALEFDDAQIARTLNRQGRRSGLGLAFTKDSVMSMRGKNRIPIAPKPRPRDEREGPFTLDEAARELEVSVGTVQRWLREGLLAGEQRCPGPRGASCSPRRCAGDSAGATALLGHQSRQPLLIERLLALVGDRPRQPERATGLLDRLLVHLDAPEHLVLDLDEVAGVVELDLTELRIAHALGMGVQRTTLTQGLDLRVATSCKRQGSLEGYIPEEDQCQAISCGLCNISQPQPHTRRSHREGLYTLDGISLTDVGPYTRALHGSLQPRCSSNVARRSRSSTRKYDRPFAIARNGSSAPASVHNSGSLIRSPAAPRPSTLSPWPQLR